MLPDQTIPSDRESALVQHDPVPDSTAAVRPNAPVCPGAVGRDAANIGLAAATSSLDEIHSSITQTGPVWTTKLLDKHKGWRVQADAVT